MRGLKQVIKKFVNEVNEVALYMGAWIETGYRLANIIRRDVALYMGAWIETCKPNAA